MYPIFLSLRFVQRHWLMTLIGAFFVGASLVVLILVMAVMDGFQSQLKATYVGSTADLIVTPRFEADLDQLAVAMKGRFPDSIAATAPHYETITMVRRSGDVDRSIMDEFQVGRVFGIDGIREQQVNSFGQYITTKDSKSKERLVPQVDLTKPFDVWDPDLAVMGFHGVILGHDLMRELHVLPGQKVKLFSLRQHEADPAGNGGNVALDDFELKQELFVVVGIYKSGNSEIDGRSVFMSHEKFDSFFNARTSRRAVRARLRRGDNDFPEIEEVFQSEWREFFHKSLPQGVRAPPAIANPDTPMIAAFRVEPWWAQYLHLVLAIQSEKRMILVIAFLIVLAGTSSIFAAQWLLVSDKVREIGILRSLGAGVKGVAATFILNGFLMGVLGAVGGTLGGLLVVRHIDTIHDWISALTGQEVFDSKIYLFEKIPTEVDPQQVTMFATAALVCTLIAAAIPALRAGLMDPARALHHE